MRPSPTGQETTAFGQVNLHLLEHEMGSGCQFRGVCVQPSRSKSNRRSPVPLCWQRQVWKKFPASFLRIKDLTTQSSSPWTPPAAIEFAEATTSPVHLEMDLAKHAMPRCRGVLGEGLWACEVQTCACRCPSPPRLGWRDPTPLQTTSFRPASSGSSVVRGSRPAEARSEPARSRGHTFPSSWQSP